MDIHEYDTVKTLVEKGGFPAGFAGVVIDKEPDGSCLVEFWGDEDLPVDAVTFSPDEPEFLF